MTGDAGGCSRSTDRWTSAPPRGSRFLSFTPTPTPQCRFCSPTRNQLVVTLEKPAPRSHNPIPALGNRHYGEGKRAGVEAAVGPPRIGVLGNGKRRGSRRRADLHRASRSENKLKAWADAGRAEGEAFIILEDFNRRIAVPGDWAWELLSPSSAPLHLLPRP